MCLTIFSPKSTDPLIAEKDIEVLKVILCDDEKDDVYFTPYMHYQLDFDEDGKCVMETARLRGEYLKYEGLINVYKDIIYWEAENGAVKTDVFHQYEKGSKVANAITGMVSPYVPSNYTGGNCEMLEVYEGLHGWMTMDSAEQMRYALSVIDAFGSFRMKYFDTDLATGVTSMHLCPIVTVKAVVPKGSMYFLGNYNDIVADKMIIFKPEQ